MSARRIEIVSLNTDTPERSCRFHNICSAAVQVGSFLLLKGFTKDVQVRNSEYDEEYIKLMEDIKAKQKAALRKPSKATTSKDKQPEKVTVPMRRFFEQTMRDRGIPEFVEWPKTFFYAVIYEEGKDAKDKCCKVGLVSLEFLTEKRFVVVNANGFKISLIHFFIIS